MYGPKGVGKTSFMAKGHGMMNDGIDAGFLRADVKLKGPEALDFMALAMRHGMFPDPTSKLRSYNLKLKRGVRTAMEFQWVDVIGDTIYSSSSGYEEVERATIGADVLMMFQSCPNLMRTDEESIIRNARDLQAMTSIAERRFSRNSDFKLYLVMTKCDSIDRYEMIELNDLMRDVMSHAYVPVRRFFVTCNRDRGAHTPDLVMYSIFLDELYRKLRYGIGSERHLKRTARIIAEWMDEKTGDPVWMSEYRRRVR